MPFTDLHPSKGFMFRAVSDHTDITAPTTEGDYVLYYYLPENVFYVKDWTDSTAAIGGGGGSGQVALFGLTDSVTVPTATPTTINIAATQGAWAANFDISDPTKIVVTPDSAGLYLLSGGLTVVLNEAADYRCEFDVLMSAYPLQVYHRASPVTPQSGIAFNLVLIPTVVNLVNTNEISLSVFQTTGFDATVINSAPMGSGAVSNLVLTKIG